MIFTLHVSDGDAGLGISDKRQVLGKRFPLTPREGVIGHLWVCQRTADQRIIAFLPIQGWVSEEQLCRIYSTSEIGSLNGRSLALKTFLKDLKRCLS